LEGILFGLPIEKPFIDNELRRRQLGYGRGGRMQIERDHIEIVSGVRHGKTIGSPISFVIENRDWSHWEAAMSPDPAPNGTNLRSISRPRPGHADLAGAIKYNTGDIRNILERASARETAARVAVGAFCKLMLQHFDIRLGSHVLSVGEARVDAEYENLESSEILKIDPESPLRCADAMAEALMMSLIDQAKKAGDTLGGVLEVVAVRVPAGLGSHTQWDRKMDGQLAQALMSIPAAKAVEIGEGVTGASRFGSQVHDEIFYDAEARQFYRKTNRAGGLEGGVTNGADLRARVYMKPIPTLRKPLMSVDLHTKEAFEAAFERSDTCVVPAAAVIAEAMTAIVLAGAMVEKFSGDSMEEMETNFDNYRLRLKEF
jgi:chorismate synthase